MRGRCAGTAVDGQCVHECLAYANCASLVRPMKIDETRAAPGWQFASDNTAGICPEAWEALQAANVGYAPSYGEDAWTERACD